MADTQALMFSFVLKKLSKTTGGAAMTVAAFSFLSSLVAIFRERLLASRFGAGDTLDMYYAAFRLPDFFFQTFILGALSAAFIPVFLEVYNKDKQEGWRLAAAVLWILIVAMLGLSVVLFIVAPWVVPWFVPGFTPEKQLATIHLSRYMLVGIIFLTASNVFSATLQSLRRFAAASLAPILYNLGIIGGIVFLEPSMGPRGLALGVVIGAALHALSQLPSVIKAGLNWHPVLLWNKEIKEVFTLMVPRMFSLVVNQVNQTVIIAISSTLALGSVAVYNLANNLVTTPVNILAISMAVASFPVFAQSVIKGTANDFVQHFSWVVRRILYMMIPITIIFILLRAQIIRLIYGAGKFTWANTMDTFQVFAILSLSLFAQAIIPVLVRSFFAHRDTKTPVFINIASVILQGTLAWWWAGKWGIMGVALAISAGFVFSLLAFYLLLRIKVGSLDEKGIFKAIGRISLASLLMAVVVQLIKTGAAVTLTKYNPEAMQTFVGILIQGGLAGGVGLLFYIVLTLTMRFPEVAVITDRLKARQK